MMNDMTGDFSKWIMPKIEKIGGLSIFYDLIPEFDRRIILLWIHGLQIPGYKAQLAVSRALDCEMAEIREVLGKPHTPFAELLTRKILPHGNSADFPRKTGISATTYEKWIAEGRLPVNSVALGEHSSVLRDLAEALILWGDPTPKAELMAQLVTAVNLSIEAKRSAKRQNNNISRKISKDCDLAKIAT